MAADNTSMIAGLFTTPEQYQQAQQAQALQTGIQMAQLPPDQRGAAMLYAGGQGLGNAIGGAMGAEDPMLQLMSIRKQVLQGLDPTDSAAINKAAQALAQAGDQQGALQLAQKALDIRNTESQISGRTEERQAQRETQVQIAREKIQAQIDAAKARGESEERIARLQIEGRQQLAQIMASMKGEKPLTEYQGKAVTFGTRAAESSNILNNLEGEYSSMSANYLPSFLNSSKGQQAQQAQQNFVNAVLRQESGAAINSSEFENARKQYFPQPGDKPEVIEQKKRNREMVIGGFARQAGPGGADIKQVFDNPPPKVGKTSFNSVADAEKANLPKGTIITIGGKQAIVE